MAVLGRSWPQNRRRTQTPTYLPYEHSSTPAVVRSVDYANIATISSASFTPPAGCLVVALFAFQWGTTTASTTLFANDSSGGGNWASIAHAEAPSGQHYCQVAIFAKYFATSPGPITVTAGKSGVAECTVSLGVRCVMNADSAQVGAAATSAYVTGTVNGLQRSITATQGASLVYVVGEDDANNTETVNPNTTTIDLWQNANVNSVNAIGRSTRHTSAPGAVSYGWTGATSADQQAIALMEVLVAREPAAGPTVYDKTGGCGPSAAPGGAKTVTAGGGTGTTGLSYVEDVNAVAGTTSVTVGGFVGTPADGDLAYCYVVNKPSSTTPPTPSGWTQLDSVAVGTGADGAGTGLVRITVFVQTVAGSYTAPTITNSGTGAAVAAGTLLLRPNADTVVSHTTTSAQDTVDDATWSLTGAADLGIQDDDMVITVDGFSNNVSGAASAGTLTGAGITAGTVTELTDSQMSSGNRGQLVANLFRDITGISTGAQTHGETLSGSLTNRTGGTLFVRVRAQGVTATTYVKAGGCGPAGAPGGAKTVQAPVTTVDTGTAAPVGAPGGAKTVQNPVTSTKAGTSAAAAAPGGAKAVQNPVAFTKAGTSARVSAPGGAKTVTAATTYTKAGTAALAGTPGGAKVLTPAAVVVKAGTSAAAGVPGGVKTVLSGNVIAKAGAAAPVLAGGGPKAIQSAGAIVKAGSSALAAAPGGPARITCGWLYAGDAAALAGSWVDLPGAVGSSTTDTPATSTGTGPTTLTIELFAFGAQGTVPYNAPVDVVAVRVRHAEDPAGPFTSVTAQGYVGATPVGSAQPLTVGAGEHEETVQITGVSYADLADLRVRVTAVRA